jgi:penicillin-binding protein 1C
MKTVQIPNLPFRNHGLPCHLYGNGTISSTIRNTNHCHLCGEDSFQSMQFIYPPMNAHIKLPKQLDGSKGFLTVELAHSNPNATIFWHLDDTYQTQTQDFHKISLQPAPGKHSLTAVDGEGNTVSTTFFIE